MGTARAPPLVRVHPQRPRRKDREDISDLVGHSGTTVTESVYRHEIRPALTTANGHEQDPQQEAGQIGQSASRQHQQYQPGWLPVWLPKIKKGFRTKIQNPF